MEPGPYVARSYNEVRAIKSRVVLCIYGLEFVWQLIIHEINRKVNFKSIKAHVILKETSIGGSRTNISH